MNKLSSKTSGCGQENYESDGTVTKQCHLIHRVRRGLSAYFSGLKLAAGTHMPSISFKPHPTQA